MANRIEGQITAVDSFGNLVTDITRAQLAAAPTDETVRIVCDEHETLGIFSAYTDQPPMTLIALVGSTGTLELAIVDESAALMLGIKPGAKVQVTW
ncbi:MAG TPA: SAM hydroxide adenosyltransferase [Lacipirellulaceae bacterium]|nr:SAM hydroxide adenosyltransferase [Lacipirellulaceae bacterium]